LQIFFDICTIASQKNCVAISQDALNKDKSEIVVIGTKYAFKVHMQVVLAIDGDRISPVLDAARYFLLVTAGLDGALTHRKKYIAEADPVTKAKRIVELGGRTLICGAVSWPLEAMLNSAGIRVIPNTCGPLEEVIAAFFRGDLTEQAFLMPGCPGRQYRHRHRHGMKWRKGY
jgi:predicted Fe-Mo cluster-binding NifX family protein